MLRTKLAATIRLNVFMIFSGLKRKLKVQSKNFTGGLAQMLAEKGIRVSDLDAANSLDHDRGGSHQPLNAGTDKACRAAGRTRDRRCDARRSIIDTSETTVAVASGKPFISAIGPACLRNIRTLINHHPAYRKILFSNYSNKSRIRFAGIQLPRD
jgi:hypothetical protein